jgi:hypothetical protein
MKKNDIYNFDGFESKSGANKLDLLNIDFYTEIMKIFQAKKLISQEHDIKMLYNLYTNEKVINKELFKKVFEDNDKEALKEIKTLFSLEYDKEKIQKYFEIENHKNKLSFDKKINLINTFIEEEFLPKDVFEKYFKFSEDILEKNNERNFNYEELLEKIYKEIDVNSKTIENIDSTEKLADYIFKKVKLFKKHFNKEYQEEIAKLPSIERDRRNNILTYNIPEIVGKTFTTFKVLHDNNIIQSNNGKMFEGDNSYQLFIASLMEKIKSTNNNIELSKKIDISSSENTAFLIQKIAQLFEQRKIGVKLEGISELGSLIETYNKEFDIKEENLNKIQTLKSNPVNHFKEFIQRYLIAATQSDTTFIQQKPNQIKHQRSNVVSTRETTKILKEHNNELKDNFNSLMKELSNTQKDIPLENENIFILPKHISNIFPTAIDKASLINITNTSIKGNTNQYNYTKEELVEMRGFDHKIEEVKRIQNGNEFNNEITLNKLQKSLSEIEDKPKHRILSNLKYQLLMLGVVDSKYLNDPILNDTQVLKSNNIISRYYSENKKHQITPEIIESNILDMYNYTIHSLKVNDRITNGEEFNLKNEMKIENIDKVFKNIDEIGTLLTNISEVLLIKNIDLITLKKDLFKSNNQENYQLIEKIYNEKINLESMKDLLKFSKTEIIQLKSKEFIPDSFKDVNSKREMNYTLGVLTHQEKEIENLIDKNNYLKK